ncbi:hypothetical protein BV22DRAFT_612741 [Leucogyrophana mollusca]|uniref:Uncharacterized protein n=1 Tax=Leucogyrophana mollusca TaxID=85980 RepID=A0ACB8BB73_9AGAM|nr:hypothetical protein BV22DRAFT_612741 [Leucogyrophana mollusca]
MSTSVDRQPSSRNPQVTLFQATAQHPTRSKYSLLCSPMPKIQRALCRPPRSPTSALITATWKRLASKDSSKNQTVLNSTLEHHLCIHPLRDDHAGLPPTYALSSRPTPLPLSRKAPVVWFRAIQSRRQRMSVSLLCKVCEVAKSVVFEPASLVLFPCKYVLTG